MPSQLSIFSEAVPYIPETEGIKYAGSKLKLLPHILHAVKKLKVSSVWDAFSGTTRVSQALAKSGYAVISSDISVWSKVFGTSYLLNKNDPNRYSALIEHLNALSPQDGWFSENYGGVPNGGSSVQRDGLKRPWQLHNTRKLDAIREEIDNLRLPELEKSIALTSLILALDEVDSTIGHFASYLQGWSARSYKEMKLSLPRLYINEQKNSVECGNVFDLAKDISVDLAYIDPPYGSNNEKMPPSRVRYSSYYHVWTTVCLNDKPKLFGKARRREDTSDLVASSEFEDFRKDEQGRYVAIKAVERLIREVNAKYVVLSYSSGGSRTSEELNAAILSNGEIIETIKIDYKKNVMAGMRWTNEWLRDTEEPNVEFIFVIEK